MDKQVQYDETEQSYDLRHAATVLALVSLGIFCSVFDIGIYDTVWNAIATHTYKILFFSGIILLLGLGIFWSQARRIIRLLNVTRGAVYNWLFAIIIPFASYRICESNNFIEAAGMTIVLIFLAWPMSLLGPLCKRTTRNTYQIPKDQFERNRYVKKFTQLLIDNLKKPDELFNRIAISASWGTGKTDFIQRVIEELETERKRGNLTFHTHLVGPWQAKTHEEAYELIIKGIDAALGLSSPRVTPVGKFFISAFSLLGFKTPSKEINSLLESCDTTLNQKKLLSIDKWLQDRNRRVVVFVDDMERVEPGSLRKVFPALNLLKPLKSCCFVFAIDPERIARAFESSEEANGYINKIFDLHLTLPIPEKREVIRMAYAEVSEKKHPFLHQSIHLMEPVLPRTPRALKQWLQRCKAKEDMFFKGTYEFPEKNFPAFYLKELIEYEYPGYETFVRGTMMDSLTKEMRGKAYTKFVRRYYGMENDDDDQNASSTSDQNDGTDPMLKMLSAAEQEKAFRLVELTKHMEKLIEQDHSDAQFSFSWICSEYTMIVGLPLGKRAPLMAAFHEAPKRTMPVIIEETFSDIGQADQEATANDFFSYYLEEEVENLMKGLKDSTLPDLINNLETLAKHIGSLETLPEYLEHRYRGFLECFQMLPNLTKFNDDDRDSITQAMLTVVKNWARILPFREIQHLFHHSKPWLAEHQPLDESSIPPWKEDLDRIYLDIMADRIVTAATNEFFSKTCDQPNKYGDYTNYYLTHYWTVPKKLIEKKLKNRSLSADFLTRYLRKMLWPNTTDLAIEAYILKLAQYADYYSLFTVSDTKLLDEASILKYSGRAKHLLEKINNQDLKKWFKTSYFSAHISKILFKL